jgi:GWxTD domain-containing protein
VLASNLSTKSIEELDEMYAQSEYLANHAEKKKWKKLSTIDGKRSFLYDFWSARDEDPATGVNETMQAYFERVKYANQHFANFMQKEGWKTDMGRVWIMYGKPYEIERHPNEKDVKPYEIWFYSNIEGGVIFVFGDITGFGEYRLLHSDKRGELQDPNWQHRISSQ